MDATEVSEFNDTVKPRKIQRSVAVTNLFSPEIPQNSKELKSGDEDEGYNSRRSSTYSSSSTSKTSLHSNASAANIPSTILENDEDLEASSSGCGHVSKHKAPKVLNSPSGPVQSCAKKDSIESTAANIQILPNNHEGEGSSPSEDLSSKVALLKLTESSAHHSVQKCSLCDSQINTRRFSYQHPPLHPRVHYRRGSETTVSAKPLQPEKEPTCIMCRRNSQKMSPPPKRKLSSTKSYVFKATPMRRWNSEIIVSFKNI